MAIIAFLFAAGVVFVFLRRGRVTGRDIAWISSAARTPPAEAAVYRRYLERHRRPPSGRRSCRRLCRGTGRHSLLRVGRYRNRAGRCAVLRARGRAHRSALGRELPPEPAPVDHRRRLTGRPEHPRRSANRPVSRPWAGRALRVPVGAVIAATDCPRSRRARDRHGRARHRRCRRGHTPLDRDRRRPVLSEGGARTSMSRFDRSRPDRLRCSSSRQRCSSPAG
jgi:hypothetical protein